MVPVRAPVTLSCSKTAVPVAVLVPGGTSWDPSRVALYLVVAAAATVCARRDALTIATRKYFFIVAHYWGARVRSSSLATHDGASGRFAHSGFGQSHHPVGTREVEVAGVDCDVVAR